MPLIRYAVSGMGTRAHRRCLPARRYSLDGRALYEEFLRCTGRSAGIGLEFGIDGHVDGYYQGVSYSPFGRTLLILFADHRWTTST
jgi:hypothetical protein